MRADILKPGLLISLGSSIDGGVSYDRSNRETLPSENGEERVKWDTERLTRDPQEHAKAVSVRSLVCNTIERLCVKTRHGVLLCPEEKESDLDDAIEEAQGIASEFNSGATYTSVSLTVYKGRIEETDEANTRQIVREIQGLLSQMERGVIKLDAAGIRRAANRARELGQILSDEDQERVGAAITSARKAARTISKRLEKGGEEAAAVADAIKRMRAVAPIETARFAFLDEADPRFAGLDDTEPTLAEQMPSVGVQRFADLDLESNTAEPAEIAASPSNRRELD